MDSLSQNPLDDNIPRKQCAGPCERWLSDIPEFFYHAPHRKSSESKCRECRKHERGIYYQENDEQIRAKVKTYRRQNLAKIKKADKARLPLWRKDHPEKLNGQVTRHNRNVKKKCETDPELKEVLNTRHNFLEKQKRERVRNEIITLLGGVCVRCGFSDKRALQVDHVNGGGRKEMYARKSRSAYQRALLQGIKDNPEKYQLLCANCNWIKRYEEDENNRWRKKQQ